MDSSAIPQPRRRRRIASLALGLVLVAATEAEATARVPQASPPRLTGPDAVLFEATHRFRDVDTAIAAGYVPTHECVPQMGYHYVKPALLGDMHVDPTQPEVLVYEPVKAGKVRLAAVEFVRLDADRDTATDDDRPTLFGHPFDGPMPPHPGMPSDFVHYDLHVWIYKHNPSGQLAADNPRVRCP